MMTDRLEICEILKCVCDEVKIITNRGAHFVPVGGSIAQGCAVVEEEKAEDLRWNCVCYPSR